MSQQHIAVIGGGVAGLGAAWLLSQRHRVTLFEANDYVGGHTHTLDCDTRDGRVPVDTGFIVYNEPNYPNLKGLFEALSVATQPSDMSFAFAARNIDLEYAGDNLATLFAQRRNLLRPAFWRMTRDILRFNRLAHARLAGGLADEATLGELLDRWRLGEAFRRYYLLPMSAAIWSCPPDEILAFPGERFLRFFHNHGLIQLTDRPQWRTVVGGGREYVHRILPRLHETRTKSPVRRVERAPDGVRVHTDAGGAEAFDQVVIAAHADQALAMLDRPGFWETTLLGAFRYAANEAWLHGDTALMPRRRAVWASWNHITRNPGDGESPVSVTYWMNRLQSLPTTEDIFVSLNPQEPPGSERVYRHMHYDHPVFDRAAIRAQRLLPRIQGEGGVWYCGSYFGYGFHEDALASAVGVARALGTPIPWRDGVPAPEPVVDSAATAEGVA